MPKKVLNEEGKEEELYEFSEVEAAKIEAAKEAAKTKEEELESSISPNWKSIREKQKSLEEENNKLRKEAKEKGIELGEVTQLKQADVERIATERADQLYLKRQTERMIAMYGDRAKELKQYFEDFYSAKATDEEKTTKYIGDAARALGLTPSHSSMNSIMNLHGTPGAPSGDAGGEQPFSETKEGKEIAARLGLVPEQIKKEAGTLTPKPMA